MVLTAKGRIKIFSDLDSAQKLYLCRLVDE